MNSLDRYFELIKERPDEFKNHGHFDIVLDKNVIENYVKATGAQVGVIYESAYHIFVVDVVSNDDGDMFTYERLLKTVKGGCVIIARYKGSYVLLKQYRHAMRSYQYAFPRGFGKPDLNMLQTAQEVLAKKTGSAGCEYEHIGNIVADSGVCGNPVDVFVCELENEATLQPGITGITEVSDDEIDNMIYEGMITDGFTLAALNLYRIGGPAFK